MWHVPWSYYVAEITTKWLDVFYQRVIATFYWMVKKCMPNWHWPDVRKCQPVIFICCRLPWNFLFLTQQQTFYSIFFRTITKAFCENKFSFINIRLFLLNWTSLHTVYNKKELFFLNSDALNRNHPEILTHWMTKRDRKSVV